VDLRSRRETYNGFGEALARGFEFAVTPAIFGGIGWLLDRALGTAPLLLVVLVLFGFAGMFVRMWLGYDTEMRRHEANAPWAPKNHNGGTAR
jgi:F0F1-type ATP synthase assembly protein I